MYLKIIDKPIHSLVDEMGGLVAQVEVHLVEEMGLEPLEEAEDSVEVEEIVEDFQNKQEEVVEMPRQE